ncbi:MAG: hypothetical protein IJT34_00200 [Butyrivibrio sp.]|nr:hypothetical protein [Butyrivibrio sp.]
MTDHTEKTKEFLKITILLALVLGVLWMLLGGLCYRKHMKAMKGDLL